MKSERDDELVGHADRLELALVAKLDECAPSVDPLLLSAERVMDEEEVEVVCRRVSHPQVGISRACSPSPNFWRDSLTPAMVMSYPWFRLTTLEAGVRDFEILRKTCKTCLLIKSSLRSIPDCLIAAPTWSSFL